MFVLNHGPLVRADFKPTSHVAINLTGRFKQFFFHFLSKSVITAKFVSCLNHIFTIFFGQVHVSSWFVAIIRRASALHGRKIAKYHKTVNKAIAYAISRRFGGEHKPRSCILTTVAGVLYKTNRSWNINKELGAWEMGG